MYESFIFFSERGKIEESIGQTRWQTILKSHLCLSLGRSRSSDSFFAFMWNNFHNFSGHSRQPSLIQIPNAMRFERCSIEYKRQIVEEGIDVSLLKDRARFWLTCSGVRNDKFRLRFIKDNCQSELASPLVSHESGYEMPTTLAYSYASFSSSFTLNP